MTHLIPEPPPPVPLQMVRLPPHNDEAEMALLGAILHNNRAFERVIEFLRPEHFANRIHGKIFEAVGKLIDRGQIADPITLKQYFAANEDLIEVGGFQYLMTLAGSLVSVINAEDYGRVIHELFVRRQLAAFRRQYDTLQRFGRSGSPAGALLIAYYNG